MVSHRRPIPIFAITLLGLFELATLRCAAQELTFAPYNKTGIYKIGEKVGWTVAFPEGTTLPMAKYTYALKKNNFDVIKSGELDLSSGKTDIEISTNEPAMLYLQLTPEASTESAATDSNKETEDKSPSDRRRRAVIAAGAAVAPTQLRPSVERPADFDEFWNTKIKTLREIPENTELTPGDSGKPDVEYATIKMDHINGAHVYGQLAKPKREGKFPALVIFQWASPPYPLQKSWVTNHAASGWLTLNIEPHDVLPDQPQSYYDALPSAIKNYQTIGNDDRDKSYFLQMYLADYRAVDYIAGRPDWDGKTLVVMGTSMGGQQSLCVAGLHPQITHLIVDEPAGCDTNGPLHGRQSGYPNFPSRNSKIMETALYFDAVNFAPRIKGKCLVAMGFVDTTAPPAGIWTAFNQIAGPKEAVPMIDSPHNNLATPAQQRPYTQRSAEWLNALVRGEDVKPNAVAEPVGEVGHIEPQSRYDDHQNMMDQLGIKRLRRGADGNDQSIYDEAKANPYKDSLPDVLTIKNGSKVTRPEQWPQRRAEILEDFEREVYGWIPKNVPAVKWEVTATTESDSGGIPTITKTLVGHVDNRVDPNITVNIQASFTVPANTSTPVPIMIVFGGAFGRGGFGPRPGGTPIAVPWTQQAIAHGWGYGYINPGSIQPDNNQLRSGIIGLTNKGEPRKPDDWGALRAWQWGVSRLIDYFEANSDAKVDPKKVGIEGVSRYGKAALVTEAFDERVAVGLIASSGEGGAKLHRHLFGEAVENLTGGEYYWMAGNFLKYGASDATFGSKTAADLPVDAHELIALCAPRPCFISYGSVEHGDPKWVDAHGSFMAGVLAGPVYRMLGKKDFGTPGDYLTDEMPPVKTLIGGELAWRQHEGGHDVTPNWPAFFEWVGKYIQAPSVDTSAVRVDDSATTISSSSQVADANAADLPVPRTDKNSQIAHALLLEKAKQGDIDIYFVGDSITRRWSTSDQQYQANLANWNQNFFGWNAANFGWGGDTTQNILWRLKNGELDGVNPKIIVVLAGTNNIGIKPGDETKVTDMARGIKAILDLCQQKAPGATIILTAIFPRNDNIAVVPTINRVNEQIAKFADGKRVRYLNVNDKLADQDGKLFDGMTSDKLHLTVKGYQVWADGLKPIFTEVLGSPAKEDHAPPPTGDPSAAGK
jgi:cephalosporin-C deacetylase-like acetyl esterase/lysophospholipase L1-like esterase